MGEADGGKADWRLEGEYFEACNCDFLCVCLTTRSKGRPPRGECKVALAFAISKGHHGDVALDGARFVVVAQSPGPMAEGNWTVGLILDQALSQAQRDVLVAIASGRDGGPMAAIASLTGTFAGVEVRPIRFVKDGMRYSVEVTDMVDMTIEGVPGRFPDQPLWVEGAGHPVTSRLALARAKQARFQVFGVDWQDDAGTNNGHFAPFSWAA